MTYLILIHLSDFELLKLCFPVHRYIPMTVDSVQVSEGKAAELNFTLAPAVSEPSGSIDLTTSSTPSTTDTNTPSPTINFFNPSQTQGVPSDGKQKTPSAFPPEHQPLQPQEFRHHSYADMELFLRKYNSEFPSIAHLYSVGRSVNQRELYVMVISDNPRVHDHGMSH